MQIICYILAGISALAALFALSTTSSLDSLGAFAALPYVISCFLWIVIANILDNQHRIMRMLGTPVTATPVTAIPETHAASVAAAPAAIVGPLPEGTTPEKAAESFAALLVQRAPFPYDINVDRYRPIIKSIETCADDENTFVVKCDFMSGYKPVAASVKIRYTSDGRSLDDWGVEPVKLG